MGTMQEEQSRIRSLLTEAVSMLCRNSLTFQHELTIEGLLGITIDHQDIFLVNINESLQSENVDAMTSPLAASAIRSSDGKALLRIEPNVEQSRQEHFKDEFSEVDANLNFTQPLEPELHILATSDSEKDLSEQFPLDVEIDTVHLENLKTEPPITCAPNPSPNSSSQGSGKPSTEEGLYSTIKAGSASMHYRSRRSPHHHRRSRHSQTPSAASTPSSARNKRHSGSPKSKTAPTTPKHDRPTTDPGGVAAVSYTCSTCGKEFASRNNCLVHERAHRGIFPYTCEFCGKGFSSSNQYKGHKNKHEGGNEYCCKLCPVKFSYPSTLQKHLRKKHHQIYNV